MVDPHELEREAMTLRGFSGIVSAAAQLLETMPEHASARR